MSRHDYLPFGEEVFANTGSRTTTQDYTAAGNLPVDKARQKFTGYEQDAETGLNFAEARYDSSSQGRFTSADSFGGSTGNPQSLNRYAYVNNNPMNLADPSGHMPSSHTMSIRDGEGGGGSSWDDPTSPEAVLQSLGYMPKDVVASTQLNDSKTEAPAAAAYNGDGIVQADVGETAADEGPYIADMVSPNFGVGRLPNGEYRFHANDNRTIGHDGEHVLGGRDGSAVNTIKGLTGTVLTWYPQGDLGRTSKWSGETNKGHVGLHFNFVRLNTSTNTGRTSKLTLAARRSFLSTRAVRQARLDASKHLDARWGLMIRIIPVTLVFLIFCGSLRGQSSTGEPKLLGSFTATSEDLLETLDNVGMVLKGSFNSQRDNIAVRVCSNEPLPVALAMSKGAPFLSTMTFQHIGIPESNMYYLRQNRHCKVSATNYASTEYWLVPKNAEFPQFVEARRASHISGYEMTHEGYLSQEGAGETRHSMEELTPNSYNSALERAVRLLEDNRTAIVVVLVRYYKLSRVDELHRRVDETLNYLKTHGIPSHRIYVKRIYSGEKIVSPEYEPKYPDVTVVCEN